MSSRFHPRRCLRGLALPAFVLTSCVLPHAFAAGEARVAEIFIRAGAGALKGLNCTDRQPELRPAEKSGPGLAAVVHCAWRSQDALLHGDTVLVKSSPVDRPAQDVDVAVPLVGPKTTLRLEAVGAAGDVRASELEISVPRWAELTRKPLPMLSPAPTPSATAAPASTPPTPAEPSRWTRSLGAGAGFITYAHPGFPGHGAWALVARVEAGYAFAGTRFGASLGAQGVSTPVAVESAVGRIRRFRYELRGSYLLADLAERASLSLFGGVFLDTMTVGLTGQGYGGLTGPMLYPNLIYRLANGRSIGASVRYSPIFVESLRLSPQASELAASLSFSFGHSAASAWSLSLDYSGLSVPVPEGDRAVSRLLALTASYRW